MQKNESEYEVLIDKINSLQATLSNLKNKLNSVYTICDTYFDESKNKIKDDKNDRRK